MEKENVRAKRYDNRDTNYNVALADDKMKLVKVMGVLKWWWG